MQANVLYLVASSVLLLQAAVDYGGYIAPVLALVATGFTVWGGVRQKRMEGEIAAAHIKSDAAQQVMDHWKQMIQNQNDELRDIRRRLRGAESHTRICERGQMKLVAQLIKAGVEVDLDKILDDMNQAERLFLENEASEAAHNHSPGDITAA